ncbi:DUF3164 family protein [Pigmentiphaga kullae]|uniref:Uncharacterized protein DUF3164 n=1 Tax=Pigmentiphaga kullae TaxID=151784 RepID=A0A4Q7NLM2_9BURK|nr:DUF3164 family protein [Pigmentiphaga kullae]RZS86041.1 uncharacterized protein DUF3164 [Pigmentiphaga kullae]
MTKPVPDGYMEDGQGRLIPVDAIKPIDLARDALVREIAEKARAMSGQLKALKQSTFADIEAFVDMSAEQYGINLGGAKGNVTLLSFDGRIKILRATDDQIVFDERLQAAKALIDECLNEWTASAGPELRAIVDRAFEVDKAGKLSTSRVLSLRRVDIKDARWQEAMRAISDSIQIVGSKSYVRVYERIDDTDRYRQIPLDVAGA